MIIRLDPEGAPYWLLDIREVQRTPDAAGAGVIATRGFWRFWRVPDGEWS